MKRAAAGALLVAVALLAAGCPEDRSAGTGPLAGGHLASAKSLARSLERLGEQLKSADDQLAAGSAHVSFEPLSDRDLALLRGRLDRETLASVEEAQKLSRALETGLDELARTPAREKPAPDKLAELRRLVGRASAAARTAGDRMASFIAMWS